MTLQQVAQQAMDYLDSAGVAADYEIITCDRFTTLHVTTDEREFAEREREKHAESWMLRVIEHHYKTKSPAK